MIVKDNISTEFHWLSKQVPSKICTISWDTLKNRSLKPPHIWNMFGSRWDLLFFFKKTNWSQNQREQKTEITHPELTMKAFTLHRTRSLILRTGFYFQQQIGMTPMMVYHLTNFFSHYLCWTAQYQESFSWIWKGTSHLLSGIQNNYSIEV